MENMHTDVRVERVKKMMFSCIVTFSLIEFSGNFLGTSRVS